MITTPGEATRRSHRVSAPGYVADVTYRYLLILVVGLLFWATGALSAAYAEGPAGEEVPKPGSRFRDCAECPEMVVVPAGKYEMGSPSSEVGRYDDEGPVHRVTIGEPFAVGVYEVTFEEWQQCTNEGGCNGYRPYTMDHCGPRSMPVVRVSWKDAQAYVLWLSSRTAKQYRLLSESEWEYMARAQTDAPFHTGPTISTNQANYNGYRVYGSGVRGKSRLCTTPVGSFQPNAFGVYDVHGNVWEWVEDCWNEDYIGALSDGSAWATGDCRRRVLRGGSWESGPEDVRAATRSWAIPELRMPDYGLRVARTLTQ